MTHKRPRNNPLLDHPCTSLQPWGGQFKEEPHQDVCNWCREWNSSLQITSQSKINHLSGFKHVRPVTLQNRAVNTRAEGYQRRSPLQRPPPLNKSCLAEKKPEHPGGDPYFRASLCFCRPERLDFLFVVTWGSCTQRREKEPQTDPVFWSHLWWLSWPTWTPVKAVCV